MITVMVSPFMPKLPERIWEQTGLQRNDVKTWESIQGWGGFPAGTRVRRGASLFPRIENKPNEVDVPQATAEGEFISIEDFARIDLRLAEILSAEKVEKADKLLKLEVAVGEERRTVVAGIAKHYAPEDLVGRNIVIVANLKPTNLRGILSEGMILAASEGDSLGIVTVDQGKEVPAGARIK